MTDLKSLRERLDKLYQEWSRSAGHGDWIAMIEALVSAWPQISVALLDGAAQVPKDAADQLEQFAALTTYWHRTAIARGQTIEQLDTALGNLVQALAGLIGLVQLVSARNDFPPGLNMSLNHRMVDARTELEAAEKLIAERKT